MDSTKRGTPRSKLVEETTSHIGASTDRDLRKPALVGQVCRVLNDESLDRPLRAGKRWRRDNTLLSQVIENPIEPTA
jgi:hypothetical protein